MNKHLSQAIRQILMAGTATVIAAGIISTANAALGQQNPPPGPGQVPDYFGITPNYATSPQPIMAKVTASSGTGTGAAATTFDYVNDAPTYNLMDVKGGSGYAVTDTVTVEGADANGPTSCSATVASVTTLGAATGSAERSQN